MMDEQERLRVLKDIQTCLKIIKKQNVRPYAYRLTHHGQIHGAVTDGLKLVDYLIKDAEKEEAP